MFGQPCRKLYNTKYVPLARTLAAAEPLMVVMGPHYQIMC
jgi:hypothetical protein